MFDRDNRLLTEPLVPPGNCLTQDGTSACPPLDHSDLQPPAIVFPERRNPSSLPVHGEKKKSHASTPPQYHHDASATNPIPRNAAKTADRSRVRFSPGANSRTV